MDWTWENHTKGRDNKVPLPLHDITIHNDEDLVRMLDFITWNQHKIHPQFIERLYNSIDEFHEQRETRLTQRKIKKPFERAKTLPITEHQQDSSSSDSTTSNKRQRPN